MKLYALLALATLSLPAFAQQTCYVDLVHTPTNRILQTITAYGDPATCVEGMKECRKAIRFDYSTNPNYPSSSLDCIRVGNSQPIPQPQPQPQPNPYPQPQPNPYPGNIPYEVSRMTEIEQAVNFALQGCHVIPRVSGWANQLMVGSRFAGNFEAGSQDIQLIRAIRDNQRQGLCLLKPAHLLNIQFRPSLIQEAIDHELSSNCHVLPRVSGWANQLFVNGNHAGNFDASKPEEDAKLRAAIADRIQSGACMERNYEEVRLMRDPRLIQDFANYQYRNCHVKLNVSGWANQVYVRNQFVGNYDRNTEVQKLKSALVALVMNGTCRFDPI